MLSKLPLTSRHISLDWAMMSFRNYTKGCLDFAEGKGQAEMEGWEKSHLLDE